MASKERVNDILREYLSKTEVESWWHLPRLTFSGKSSNEAWLDGLHTAVIQLAMMTKELKR
jgi:rhamnogalacturonyl hydrolase YesR